MLRILYIFHHLKENKQVNIEYRTAVDLHPAN